MSLLACGEDASVAAPDAAVDQAPELAVADPGPQPDEWVQVDLAEVQPEQELPTEDLADDLDQTQQIEVTQEVTPDAPSQPDAPDLADAPDVPPGIPCKVNDDCPPATEACTEARCEAKLGVCKVLQAKENAPCDDGESCTVGDLCKAGQCHTGQNGCGCGKDGDCAAFDDGNPCNGKWFCDASVSPTVCAPTKGSQVTCPPSDSLCTANLCNAVSGACELTATNDGGACEDGKVCTSGDHCASGECLPGKDECPCKKNSDCSDDGDPCTGGDSCSNGQCAPGVNTCGCQTDAECQKFDDGNLCNGALYCNKAVQPHQCQVNPATVVVCPSADDTACAQNNCDPGSGKCAVQLAKDGSTCDDDNPGTQGDACATGKCAGPTNICPCTSNTQCAAKDDGNLCNGSLFCDKSKLPYQCNLNPATVIKCSTLQDNSCQRALCTPSTGACQLAAVNEGVGCDADANACTVGDVCTAGQCKPGTNNCPCTQDTDCKPWDDGNLCNGTLYCDKAAKACLVNPNTVVTCASAGDSTCAANSCNPSSGNCAMTPRSQGQPCDGDGNACTVGDVCDKGICVVGTNTCGCQSNSDCTAMNDNNLCNGTLYCDKATLPFQCKVNPVTVKDCSKGTPPLCQVNSCNPATGVCGFTPVEDYSPCSDNSLCTIGDTCKAGKCIPGSNLCECFADSDCGGKEDGNQCNGTLYCDKGKVPFKCKVNPASVVVCDATGDQPCVKNLCQASNGACAITVISDATNCEDGNVCTLQDQCSKGLCTGQEVVCNDGNACTFDDCDPLHGCLPIANAVAACDDGNACTADSCDAKAGCAHGPVSGVQVCSDGDPCSGPDLCQGGVCQGKPDGGCDDGNPCTSDSCVVTGKACLHAPNSAPCGDDLVCSGGRCGGCGAFARQQRVGCDLVVGWPYYDKIPEQCKITVNNDREEGEDMVELSDGRLAMVGAASTDGSAATKGWLIVLESTGKWVGDWTFGKAGLTRLLSAASDGKGGLWTAGVTANASGTARPWLVHLSGSGAILSETLLPAEATAGSASGQFDTVAVLGDSSVVAAGFSQLPGTSTTDALVARLDSQGKPIWQKAFGGSTPGIAPQNERMWGVVGLTEGTFVLAGQRANPMTAQNKTDGWLLKVDARASWCGRASWAAWATTCCTGWPCGKTADSWLSAAATALRPTAPARPGRCDSMRWATRLQRA